MRFGYEHRGLQQPAPHAGQGTDRKRMHTNSCSHATASMSLDSSEDEADSADSALVSQQFGKQGLSGSRGQLGSGSAHTRLHSSVTTAGRAAKRTLTGTAAATSSAQPVAAGGGLQTALPGVGQAAVAAKKLACSSSSLANGTSHNQPSRSTLHQLHGRAAQSLSHRGDAGPSTRPASTNQNQPASLPAPKRRRKHSPPILPQLTDSDAEPIPQAQPPNNHPATTQRNEQPETDGGRLPGPRSQLPHEARSMQGTWVALRTLINLKSAYKRLQAKEDTQGMWLQWHQCRHIMRGALRAALGLPLEGCSRNWGTIRQTLDKVLDAGITHMPLACVAVFMGKKKRMPAAGVDSWMHSHWWPPSTPEERYVLLSYVPGAGADLPGASPGPSTSPHAGSARQHGLSTSVCVMEAAEAFAFLQQGVHLPALRATRVPAQPSRVQGYASGSRADTKTSQFIQPPGSGLGLPDAIGNEADLFLRCFESSTQGMARSSIHEPLPGSPPRQHIHAPVYLGLSPLASPLLPKLGCGSCIACTSPGLPHQPCLRVGRWLGPKLAGVPEDEGSEDEDIVQAADGNTDQAVSGRVAVQHRAAALGRGAGSTRTREGVGSAPKSKQRWSRLRRERELHQQQRREISSEMRVHGQAAVLEPSACMQAVNAWRAAVSGADACLLGRVDPQHIMQPDSVMACSDVQLNAWSNSQQAALATGHPQVSLEESQHQACGWCMGVDHTQGQCPLMLLMEPPHAQTQGAQPHGHTLRGTTTGQGRGGPRLEFRAKPGPSTASDSITMQVMRKGSRGAWDEPGLQHTQHTLLLALEQQLTLQHQLSRAPAWLQYVGPQLSEGMAAMRRAMAWVGWGSAATGQESQGSDAPPVGTGSASSQNVARVSPDLWQSPEVCLALVLLAEEQAAATVTQAARL